MRRTAALTALLSLVAATASAPGVAHAGSAPAQWQPGTPPISTPWTAEVGPDNALPEYPRPQLVRNQWQSLNGVWQFAGAAEGEAPPFGDELSERVLVPYPIESALSGIQRREDRMWYKRAFRVPTRWQVGGEQRLRLNFGAVDHDAVVWVNGTRVATHRGGFDGFSVDVTDALRPAGQQELIVGVTDLTDQTWQPVGKQRNVPDRGIFYTSASGIWQSVWMEPVAAGHIERLQLTPDLADGSLRLTALAEGGSDLRVEAAAYNGSRVVGRVSGAAGAELRLPVRNPKLWSPDSPFLYDLTVKLFDGSRRVDIVTSYFGMREVGTKRGADGKPYMTLNGDILFNMSTLDQGFWPDGIYTAPTDEALRFDVAEHKRLGFNTIRKHIKVEPDRWYYWADKLGLMVWQDMPSMRTGGTPPEEARQEFERQLHEIVEEHRSWTSITVWVPFNEGWGEWDRVATGRIADAVKAQDPSRLVNAHSGVNCCNSHGDSGRGDILDYHQYLGPASPVPSGDRVAADGEHGGLGLEVEGHMWFGEGHGYEMTPDSATLTARYVQNQRDLLTIANRCGLSAGVYTQITDVEHEVNGFYTYDRQVEKMDFDRVRDVNLAVIRSVDGSGANVPQPPPGTPGLTGVGYWPMDEGSGTVTADAAGDHDGTLVNGPTWTPGRSGSALQFNGANQYVDTGAAILDTTAGYTASAWVRLDSLGGFATAVSQDGDSHSAFFLQYSGADNRFAFSFAGIRALAPAAPETGRWYHLTGVRDLTTGSLTLYVDGQRAGTANACLGDRSSGHTVIGRGKFNGNPVDHWRGALDQVRVYDRALSAAEVAQLYTSGG
ncbi:LamG-like jellyroll fold domain-containing protein [Phytohabitans houttuyneae]|uniref:Glycoside hydrolase n=1 Tax=Phytohabitans houttuyneae TaxID=1076126 RepID=A0A6V8JX18_9ACTN|nr:LamG-like jellyroll fold domain-containing protein [Phytohabitans houttuyneae]GFJ77232.1 glycoside hydrolase [Phytohabitans houttuyneae]